MRIFAREIYKLNNNMKRFFISAIAIMSCFMANAQKITIPTVNVPTGGEKTVSVSLANATQYTAFQFDIALPQGVTVKSVGMNNKPDTRKIESGTVNGKFRVLSYDNGNAKFNSESVLSLTFASTGTTTSTTEAEVSTIVVVKDDATGPDVATGTVAINVQNGVAITIGDYKMATFVSDKDLDFSNAAVKAYIATGYDYTTNDILLTRVYDVPANTPILVMGEPSGNTPYVIPLTTSRIYYPENFLKGKATASAPVDQSGKYYNMLLKNGMFSALDASVTEFPQGLSYLQIPKTVESATGAAFSCTIDQYGVKSYTNTYDLDFENVAVKAYVVTGYDKDNNVWLTRVNKVSTNTPLVLLGTAGDYQVPSSAQQTCYVNMLRGNANQEIPITPEANGWINMIVKQGSYTRLPVANYNVPAGSSYLPIPSSIVATSRGEFVKNQQMNIQEAEVITLKAVLGGENDGTTGISRLDSEVVGDVWYNLSGQRIDTPTKKGLYIKNGKKVIVK